MLIRKCPYEIKIDFDSEESMREKQRRTILINGQLIPTYQTMFEEHIRIEEHVHNIRMGLIANALVTFIAVVIILILQ